MMAYPLPRLAMPMHPGRAPSQLPLSVPRSQEGGSSPTCCTSLPVSATSMPLTRPPACLGAPPGTLCSCCPPGSGMLPGYPGGLFAGLAEGMSAAHPYLAGAPGMPGGPPENSPLYPSLTLGGAFDPKDNQEFWAAIRQSPYFPYEQGLMAHPYANAFALDPNARRKNATREGTNTLKAWLNEHKKNPYPTKGEKIMLAIITKMTLTQVSTWFANARRRLKKDNKVTWTTRGTDDDDEDGCLSSADEDAPGNGVCKSDGRAPDDDDEDIDPCEDICVTDDDNEDQLLRRLSPDVAPSPHHARPICGDDERGSDAPPRVTSSHHVAAESRIAKVELLSPASSSEGAAPCSSSLTAATATTKSTPPSAKPKIWSLADVASKDSDSDTEGTRASSASVSPPVHLGMPSRYTPPGAWRPVPHPYAAYSRPAPLSMHHRPLRVDTSHPMYVSAGAMPPHTSPHAAFRRMSRSPDQ